MAGKEPQDLPLCAGSHAPIFLGGVVLFLATVLRLALSTAGNFNTVRTSYLIGVTSVWMAMPGLLSLATPASTLSTMGPKTRLLWRAGQLLSLASCLVSFRAWFRWTAFTGLCDEVLAVTLLWNAMFLGMIRWGWAAHCTAGFLYTTCFLVILEQSFGRFQPWPHLAFRMTGLMSGFAAFNGGLLIATPLDMLCVALAAVSVFCGQVALENGLAGDCTGDACSFLLRPTATYYWGGIARAFACGLLFLLLVCPVLSRGRATLQADAEEEGTSSESESEEGGRETASPAGKA